MKSKFRGLCLNVLLLLIIAGFSDQNTRRLKVCSFQEEFFTRVMIPMFKNRSSTSSRATVNDSRYYALLLMLANDIELNPGPNTKIPSSKRRTTEKKDIDVKKSLFSELPQIKHEDYTAENDNCRKCSKKVDMRHNAISCDACLRWCHLRCSDMDLKTYKSCQQRPTFHWLCTYCREPETSPNIREHAHSINDTALTNIQPGAIMHFNCRSINNKLDDIHDILDKAKPNILVLTETWLDDSFPKGTLSFKGYKHFRKDRSHEVKQKFKKKNGGGVAIIFKDNIKVTPCKDLNKNDDEIFWASTRIKNKQLLIGAIYRPGYCNIQDSISSLEDHLQCAFQKTDRILMIGDLNVNLLATTEEDSRQKSALTDLFAIFGMRQVINLPTRVSEKTETLIDHIWVSTSLDVVNAGITGGISDHSGIFASFDTSLDKEIKTITSRSYKRYKKENVVKDYINKIANTNFNQLINEGKVSDATEVWSKVVVSICDEHAPEKTTTFNSKTDQVPWYTTEILKLKADKQEALKNSRKTGDKKSKVFLKNISNKLKYLKKYERKNYFGNKVEEFSDNNKKLWGVLKEVSGTTNEHDEVLPDAVNDSVADEFNSYFATIGKKIQLDLGIKFSFRPTPGQGGFAFKDVTPEEIEKLIDNLKTAVATGSDRIPSRILKDLKTTISKDITNLINASFKTSVFPDILKHAIITPIYKDKGSHNSSEFYRPISILPVISKVFERAATNQIVGFLEENNLLFSGQHAYRKSHSTTTALIESTNYIYRQLDNKNHVGLVATDLSKAFDTLSHDLLLSKLQNMGFGYSSITWLQSYLSNRTQQVKLGPIKSSIETTEAGVPQGSILGPILFITFTADFHLSFPNCSITSYADDTQILVSGKTKKDLKQKIEDTITTAQSWYTKNSLKINPTKTEIMVFNSKESTQPTSFTVTEDGNSKQILSKKKMKILGVVLDERLTWRDHVKHVKSKASRTIRNLARTTHVLPLKSRKTLYDALVTPHFSYCDVVWGGASKTLTNDLQKTGNFAARTLLGMKKRESATEALNKLNMMPLERKREVHLGVITHKLLQGKGPKNLVSECQSLTKRQHSHNTRSTKKRDMSIISHRTSKSRV